MKAAVRTLSVTIATMLAVALPIAGCTATNHSPTKHAASQAPASAALSAVDNSSTDIPSAAASVAGASPTAVVSSPTPAHPSTATPSPTPTPTSTPTPVAAAKTTAAPAPKPTTPAAPPPLLVQQLASVGNAQQVVIVTSASWTTDVATLQTFEKDAAGWHAVFPAMAAHIGRAGFSADKHEGDLKTPAGMYSFGVMFGQRANPGVKFAYRQADSQSVWVDDVNSAYYNTWQENAALSGEHLASSGYATAYAYAVDIAYNVNPIVKGKGSAIFLHVSTGGGTAGCVSIAQTNLLQVLRWLDPAKLPVIVMGPSSVIRQY